MLGFQDHGFHDYTPALLNVFLRAIRPYWYGGGVVVRFFLFSLIFLFSGCREPIFHNLTEAEANKILAALDEGDLKAEKLKQPDGSWALVVEKSDTYKVLRYLKEIHLMQAIKKPDLPEAGGLLQSKEDQRFRYERLLSHEIEATLLTFSSVIEARVHLNLPFQDPLFGKRISSSLGSASVLILVREEEVMAEDVSAIVAGASGIPKEAISVLVSKMDKRKEVGGVSGERFFSAYFLKDKKTWVENLFEKIHAILHSYRAYFLPVAWLGVLGGGYVCVRILIGKLKIKVVN